MLAIWVAAGCGDRPAGGDLAGTAPGATPAGTNRPGPADAVAEAEWFHEITSVSGVDFVHRTGTNYFMPDQVGSGLVLFDANGDGRLDLYCVQNAGLKGGARSRLFVQEAGLRFRDASAGSGLDLDGPGMGAIAGDVNNDGRPDVVVTEYGATRLLMNLGGGRFEDRSREAGLDNPRWAAPASFLDFDRDGWLDLVVGNYVDYDPTQTCHDVQGRRDFCAPAAYGRTSARLWRNRGGTPGGVARFEDVTESSGVSQAPGAALGLVCADFDGDGWADIFCADDGLPNRLFRNRGDGTFAEEASMRGLALNAMGRTAANMGVAYVDADADGLPDLFVTHLTEEFHALYRQDRRGWYMDGVSVAGLQQQAWRGTGFGTVMFDADADGWPDLVLVNGMVRRAVPGHEPVLPGVDPWWARYAQRAQVFAGTGGGRFADRSAANPAFCGLAQVGRSLALGDLDGDGALDLVVGTAGGPVRLFRNVAVRPGHHGLRLRLVDPASGGRDAIGAEVQVRAGASTRWGLLQPATSYLSSHEPVVHLGLGREAGPVRVRVAWPTGEAEVFEGITVDRTTTLERGKGVRDGG